MARKITFMQAINEALAEEMRRDPSVFILGEDVRVSPFGQTAGLVKEFGEERVLNTPIAENAITGAAIGAALNGMRPVLELMFSDFTMLAMDEICNHLGQWGYITGGQYRLPVTIRTAVGAGLRMGYGHSQSLESQLVQAPGLILVEPSTPYDVKGLLKSAIRSDDPVVIFEHPIVTFVVVVDHSQEANCRVNSQHPAEFPDGRAGGNFQVKGDFPETREIGVIAF